MNFTKTGTLRRWDALGSTIIPEIYEISPGKFRGGAYLCIPNFEQLPHPFEIKHGEYRTIECEETLPHEKLISSTLSVGWGKIATKTIWEESTTFGIEQLSVTSRIEALSEEVSLRPGYHPYFKVDGSFRVEAGAGFVDTSSLTVDRMVRIQVQENSSGNAIATLITSTHRITIAVQMKGKKSSDYCFSFCVWSDKPTEYVCVEPVCGGPHGHDDLPTAFTINKGDVITITSTILVSPL